MSVRADLRQDFSFPEPVELDACNEELKEALWLLNYLIAHCEGKPRKTVLDIQKRLIKIRGVINQHLWSRV